MRERWVARNREIVRVDDESAAPIAGKVHIIGDGCDLRSMADGKHYTSKSRYKAELRARGYEIVGNEKPTLAPRPHSDARLQGVLSDVMRQNWRN